MSLWLGGSTPDVSIVKGSDAELNVSVTSADLMATMNGYGKMVSHVAGSDKTLSDGVNFMGAGSSVPSTSGVGLKIPGGAASMFVMADASPVEVYGYRTDTSTWVKMDDLAARGNKSYAIGSAFTHVTLGSIEISELYVRDASGSDSERAGFRAIPQGAASVSSNAGFKNTFSQEVEMDGGLTVAGTATLGSWTMEDNTFKPAPGSDGVIQAQQSGDDIMILSWSGSEHFKSTDSDVSLGPIGLDGIYKFVATSDSVQLGPLGLDGIALNINTTGASFGKTNSVNLKADSNFIFAGKPGTTENGLYVHKDHGVCLVSSGGNVFGLRIDDSGNLSTTSLGSAVSLEVPMC